MILQPLYKSVNTVFFFDDDDGDDVDNEHASETGFKVQRAGGTKHVLDVLVTRCFSAVLQLMCHPVVWALDTSARSHSPACI